MSNSITHQNRVAMLVVIIVTAACSTPLTDPPIPNPVSQTDASIQQTTKSTPSLNEVSANLTPVPTATLAGTTESAINTYKDPELGFRLQYPSSWYFEAISGTPLIDGESGRTIELRKDLYTLEMYIQPTCTGCGCEGLIEQNKVDLYWKYTIDGIEIWRAKVEEGWANAVESGDVSIVDIISPTIFFKEPDSFGFIGSAKCLIEISGYFVSIRYIVPIRVSELTSGHVKQNILDEMDFILTSLTWK